MFLQPVALVWRKRKYRKYYDLEFSFTSTKINDGERPQYVLCIKCYQRSVSFQVNWSVTWNLITTTWLVNLVVFCQEVKRNETTKRYIFKTASIPNNADGYKGLQTLIRNKLFTNGYPLT